MSDQQFRQRIKYMVEHGGVYDDPLDDIRRDVRLNRIIAVVCFIGGLVIIGLLATR